MMRNDPIRERMEHDLSMALMASSSDAERPSGIFDRVLDMSEEALDLKGKSSLSNCIKSKVDSLFSGTWSKMLVGPWIGVEALETGKCGQATGRVLLPRFLS